jgi:hypothetical protein
MASRRRGCHLLRHWGQLGRKLESQKGQVEEIIFDQVNHPLSN